MDGFSDRGSTPLRSTKKGITNWFVVPFFVDLRKIELVTKKTPGFWTGAHEVRWTSVLRRPEQSVDRLPS